MPAVGDAVWELVRGNDGVPGAGVVKPIAETQHVGKMRPHSPSKIRHLKTACLLASRSHALHNNLFAAF